MKANCSTLEHICQTEIFLFLLFFLLTLFLDCYRIHVRGRSCFCLSGTETDSGSWRGSCYAMHHRVIGPCKDLILRLNPSPSTPSLNLRSKSLLSHSSHWALCNYLKHMKCMRADEWHRPNQTQTKPKVLGNKKSRT